MLVHASLYSARYTFWYREQYLTEEGAGAGGQPDLRSSRRPPLTITVTLVRLLNAPFPHP